MKKWEMRIGFKKEVNIQFCVKIRDNFKNKNIAIQDFPIYIIFLLKLRICVYFANRS